MNTIAIAALVFGCTFIGALAGTWLSTRLPAHHTDTVTKDVVKLVMGLVATMSALVLGLLISSANKAYDEQEAEVQQIAVHLFHLDRILASFGTDAGDARDRLRRIVAADVDRTWANGGAGAATDLPVSAQAEVSGLFDRIAALSPRSDAQRFNQTRALQLFANLGETRRLLNEQAGGSVSWPFLVVLVFWLVVLFIGFGLFARFNGTVIATFALGAISVAGAIFLILEMNRPYSGLMQISNAPIRNALTQIPR
jgi:uncharacterized membrane protein (DUF485 family)